jgi:Putative prokaryotic signal transducing protein
MVYRDDLEIHHAATGEFTTLRTYVSVLEAEFDRAALESAGIDVRLFDTGTAAIIPHGGVALGVRLQVRESELERARELLDKPDPLDESERAEHPELRKPKEDESWRQQAAADSEASRAFRAAVIGFFLCPGIGQLYAAWLLVSLLPRWRELSKAGRRSATAAVVVVFVVLAAAVVAVVVR